MDKKYHIGKGINLEGEERMPINRTNLEYSNNLLDYFDNVNEKKKFLYETFGNEYLQKRFLAAKEYEKKFGEFEDLTPQIDRIITDNTIASMGDEVKKRVSEHVKNLKKEWHSSIDFIENSMHNARNGKQENKPLCVNENGSAVGKYLVHNFSYSDNLEEYEARKDLGVLASEWFGQEEAYKEAVMCSFFVKQNEIKPKEDTFVQYVDGGLFTKEIKHPSLALVFDASNPGLQELMKNDFFLYEKNKSNPDYLQLLSDEQKKLFGLIEQRSPGAETAIKNNNWVAIPGGVPSKYAIGLVAYNLKPNSEDQAVLEKAAEIFNVPLLNSKLNVIYSPQASSEKV